MITYEQILIEGAFNIYKISDLHISVIPNSHAVAVIECVYTDIEELERWQKSDDLKEIVIRIKQEQNPIFHGYLTDAECCHGAEYYTAKLTVQSVSVMLDRKKCFASFQDINMTYKEIMEKVADAEDRAFCICTAGNNAKPKGPLIQYSETAWEFAKRLASHLNTSVFPMESKTVHGVYFGMPKPDKMVFFDNCEYRHGFSSRFYELGGEQSGWNRQDFEYYEIKSSIPLGIGDCAEYKGKMWRICEKYANIIKQELVFTYILGREPLISQNKLYNPLFTGMSLSGKVLGSYGETVKLHLDIDKFQDKSKAYPYVWTPDTGSVMYCMPQNGTTVYLYFADEDETNAAAINCVRKNGSKCSDMKNPQNRLFTTEHKKQMYMKTDSVGFSIKEKGHAFAINDENGIKLVSGKGLHMFAEGGIKIKADRFVLETPSEIDLIRHRGESR